MPDEKFDEKELEKREEKSPEEKSWDEKWQRDPLNTIAWAAILISAVIHSAYHFTPLVSLSPIFMKFPVSQFVSADGK